jgi:hypothetical protein
MQAIAEEERGYQPEVEGIEGSAGDSSFAPLPYPEGATQGGLNETESRLRQEGRPDVKVYRDSRKYLPCHYFDFICGSSTGA